MRQTAVRIAPAFVAMAAIAVLYTNGVTTTNTPASATPTPTPTPQYVLVTPDAHSTPTGTWSYWGISLGNSIAPIPVTIPTASATPSVTPSSTDPEEINRQALLSTLFAGDADAKGLSLAFNMIRFTVGADYNPSFHGANTKTTNFNVVSQTYALYSGTYNSLIAVSKNRGMCDINNDKKDFGNVACNVNVNKNCVQTSLTPNTDVVPCYLPDQIHGWGCPSPSLSCASASTFNWQSERFDDPNPMTRHERTALREALKFIPLSRSPLVETESFSIPYYAMDSGCESGHDYDFSTEDGDTCGTILLRVSRQRAADN